MPNHIIIRFLRKRLAKIIQLTNKSHYKCILFGEIQDEVTHVEFNARPTTPLPFFNDWNKIIRL